MRAGLDVDGLSSFWVMGSCGRISGLEDHLDDVVLCERGGRVLGLGDLLLDVGCVGMVMSKDWRRLVDHDRSSLSTSFANVSYK